MFIVVDFGDTVRIPPLHFNMCLNNAIEEELNRKLANKVIPDTGLCMVLYAIKHMADSYIIPGDGASYTKVSFSYVVFRPLIGEMIEGEIKRNTREGVYVSLGFFDDIFIPLHYLQNPSNFNEELQCWCWEYEAEDGERHELPMENREKIRFRVAEEIFVETRPPGPEREESVDNMEEKKIPYTIIGSIIESGLGLCSWWQN